MVQGQIDRTVAEVILTRLPNLKGADRNHAVVALASQPVLAQALMTAIKEDRSLLVSMYGSMLV